MTDVEFDEFDVPLGGLDRLSRVKFERTHLVGAAAEVRLVPAKSELSEADAVRVWEGLGKESLPIFDRHSTNLVNLTLTPSGHQQTQENQVGWILASADRTTSVTLYPNLVAVQTTRYDHYRVSLGEPLARALALIIEATGASVINRIGLRFINRLQDPSADTPEFWVEHIRDGFSGPLTGNLARLVEAAHQQTQLRLEQNAAARIISGVFREGDGIHYSFLVDVDVFREQALAYDAQLCENLARQLDRTALSLFSHVVTPAHLDDLGRTVVEAAS
ncbi:MAG TPA: TIGR04255 family protein [Acidimicrobiales bacterium]|nr:TIGR04255 family protein [Acidimicrobiales bacterium]